MPKVGQNGTDICVKLKVKLGIKRMTEVAQSYEIVRNFNNFKAFVMFAVEKFETLLILVEKFRIAYVSPETFFLLCLC